MKRFVIALVATATLAVPASAQRYYAREKVLRAQDIVATPTPTPAPAAKACGSTLSNTIWGIDGDGFTQIGSAGTDAAALVLCENRFKATKTGVCGRRTNDNVVYYWGSANPRPAMNNGLYVGTICK